MVRYSTKQKSQGSQRSLPLAENTGTRGALKSLEIQAPALRPQSSPVPSYIQTGRPNAPGQTQIGALAKIPEPAAVTDLQNLSQSLGSLNQNLQGAVSNFLQHEQVAERQAEEQAEAVASQYGNQENAIITLGNVLAEKERDSSLSDRERKGASHLLSQLQNDGRLERHLESQERQSGIISNVSTLSQKLQGITVQGEQGKEIPILSIPSSDPRWTESIKPLIYGDIILTPREYEKVKPTVVNTILEVRTQHDKDHFTYKVNTLKTAQRKRIKQVGVNLAQNGDHQAGTNTLQTVLDERYVVLPGAVDVQDYGEPLVKELVTAFRNSGSNRDVRTVLKPVIKGLFTGKPEDRYILQSDGTFKVNESLRWINQFGGELWLDEVLADATDEIIKQDQTQDLSYKTGSIDQLNKKLTEAEEGEKSIIQLYREDSLGKAAERISTLTTNWREEQIKNGIDVTLVEDVLRDFKQATDHMLGAYGLDYEKAKQRISKLVPAAQTSEADWIVLDRSIDEFEQQWGFNPDATEFIGEIREQNEYFQTEDGKNRQDGLDAIFNAIETEWKDYAGQSSSYGEPPEDTLYEFSLIGDAKVKAYRIGRKIIVDNVKAGTPGNIGRELSEQITMENIGLVKLVNIKEVGEEPQYVGSSNDALTNLAGVYDFNLPDIGPRQRGQLNKIYMSKSPFFSTEAYKEILDSLVKYEIDQRLWRLVGELEVGLGDFLLKDIGKLKGFPLNERSRQDILRFNEMTPPIGL